MLDHRPGWAKLREHRRRAESYPLDVLVWGPAAGEGLEYRKRVEIRDALKAAGHNAAFSEELVDRPDVDPLEDELLQADAAHLIVVLYGSRGTQTEIDRLLVHSRFAEKALVLIASETHAKVLGSISRRTWRRLAKLGEVLPYSSEELDACSVVGQACEKAEELRWSAYVGKVAEAAG